MALSNISGTAFCDAILTALHVTSGTSTLGTITVTAPIKIALLSSAGNQTTAGTQISGGSYVAISTGSTGGINTSTNWAAASGASQATNAVLSQTNMPAVTVTSIELWDGHATTSKRTEFGNLTASKTTASGDTLSFASGAITSALA